MFAADTFESLIANCIQKTKAEFTVILLLKLAKSAFNVNILILFHACNQNYRNSFNCLGEMLGMLGLVYNAH